MQKLAAMIEQRLKTHPYCTVFETDLSRVWPYVDKEREERHRRIKEFARERGWSATILDPGIRVTFRRLKDESKRAALTVPPISRVSEPRVQQQRAAASQPPTRH